MIKHKSRTYYQRADQDDQGLSGLSKNIGRGKFETISVKKGKFFPYLLTCKLYVSMAKKVFLWTTPRSVSTAFERSMREVKNSKVFHEPFTTSYYFGTDRISTRYLDRPATEEVSYENMCKLLTHDYADYNLVFSKDMAYSLEQNYEIVFDKRFADFEHTFMIRNPKKTVKSLYFLSVDKELTGWEAFDPVEAGFKQMYELYETTRSRSGKVPVIVDADDLLDDPESIMRAYFNAIGCHFDKSMLSWSPVPIPSPWGGWNENVDKSSGFIGRCKERRDPVHVALPEEVEVCIEECLVYYKALYEKRLLPTKRCDDTLLLPMKERR